MDEAPPSVSVVVPVFGGTSQLIELVQRVIAVLEPRGAPFEIVLVDDEGTESSWEAIEALAPRSPSVVAICLARNFGQHAALLAGIRAARYDVVVTMDDDLQHPPEQIPRLLAALTPGVDVVYGAQVDSVHGPLRSAASRLTKLALRQFMAAATAERVSAFRALRTGLRESFSEYHAPIVNIDVMLTWGTTRFTAVEVDHERRMHGSSGYTLSSLVTHALNMVTGYSVRPLQLASLLGFSCMLFGLGVLVFVLINFLVRGGRVPGFTFLAATTTIFAGIQLFALGIIGEYVARMHMRTMGKPTYVIREIAGGEGQ